MQARLSIKEIHAFFPPDVSTPEAEFMIEDKGLCTLTLSLDASDMIHMAMQ